MFPIFNLQGKVVGFGGRVLDSTNPKYINYVEHNPLDHCNKTGIPFPFNPNGPESPSSDYLPCCNDKPCHC